MMRPCLPVGTTSACAENTDSNGFGSISPGNYLRVRGEYRISLGAQGDAGGTTSACAENTLNIIKTCEHGWNYLRVRGEYSRTRTVMSSSGELPPRARRILLSTFQELGVVGTTSACAENTYSVRDIITGYGNYLRVRGEYPLIISQIHNQRGTTSACAENTPRQDRDPPQRWNYLRVRGEYWKPSKAKPNPLELPPRARRIHTVKEVFSAFFGTTSACAENTRKAERSSTKHWNYLRVRGEYGFVIVGKGGFGELPPRARRIPMIGAFALVAGGTTSACAENTKVKNEKWGRLGNYLRVRGEYKSCWRLRLSMMELPPRARRIPGLIPSPSPRGGNYLRVRGEYT